MVIDLKRCVRSSDITEVPTCNHARAHALPVSHRTDCQFIGYQCNSYAEFEEGKCADCGPHNSKCKPMEFQFDYWDQIHETIRTQPQGHVNLYLKTNQTEPFCLFHYQVLVSVRCLLRWFDLWAEFCLRPKVQISANSSSRAGGELEIGVSNGTKVKIGRSWTASDSGQDLGFKAGHNYTQLYVGSKELDLSPTVSLKWSSFLRNTIKVDAISINFMSHISERSE